VQPDPYQVIADLRDRAVRWGFYGQDEIKLAEPLTAYAGLRIDHYELFGWANSPRAGLIYTPTAGTTIKALAGRAFRAPNAYEVYANGFTFQTNTSLRPEHITTLELIGQQFIGRGVQLSMSAFRNRLNDLIGIQFDSTANHLVESNAARTESHGVDLGIAYNRGSGPSGELTYSLQRTIDVDTRAELTNSPRAMAKAQVRLPLVEHLSVGLDAQHVSGRRTQAGNVAHPYTVANLSLVSANLAGRLELTASVFNLFDARYTAPAADTQVEDVIPQDGRNFRVKTTLRF
jgi:iron complex outermembrane receptor protein